MSHAYRRHFPHLARRRRRAASSSDYTTEVSEGMVVLDAVIDPGDAGQRPGLPLELQGRQVRLVLGGDQRHAATDVHDAAQRAAARKARHHRADEGLSAHQGSGHRRVLELPGQEEDQAFKPRPPDAPDGTWRMAQADIDRVQEFRKCIECFLCQDVCHVLRDHHKHDEFIGPRFLVHVAALEMHPLDTEDRLDGIETGPRHRLLQHHQVLHQGLPGEHHDHRQRHHSAQGTRGGRVLRPARTGCRKRLRKPLKSE